MKFFILACFCFALAAADVSHLPSGHQQGHHNHHDASAPHHEHTEDANDDHLHTGYSYEAPSIRLEMPPAPAPTYLPPSTPPPSIRVEIPPAPAPTYLPPSTPASTYLPPVTEASSTPLAPATRRELETTTLPPQPQPTYIPPAPEATLVPPKITYLPPESRAPAAATALPESRFDIPVPSYAAPLESEPKQEINYLSPKPQHLPQVHENIHEYGGAQVGSQYV